MVLSKEDKINSAFIALIEILATNSQNVSFFTWL